MKLKDYVFDSERGLVTIWLTDVHPIQLENLLLILKDDQEEHKDELHKDETGFEEAIFGD